MTHTAHLHAADETPATATGRLRRTVSILSAAILGAVGATIPVADGVHAARVSDDGSSAGPIELPEALTRPHVLTGGIADVIVRIHGGNACTGTPITATRLVVTAAHCVLDSHGALSGPRTVERDGVEYAAVSVLVNPDYTSSPGPLLDAAVLVMDRVVPGPSAMLGEVIPDSGLVTLAGVQPLDTDGTLLRGSRFDNRPLPKGATSGVITIDTAAAGCVRPATDLTTTATQVTIPCGLIPGASGGGLFVEHDGALTLIGITSTVTPDLTGNGLVPLESLHTLLSDPIRYTYEVPHGPALRSVANVVRS